MKITEKIIPWDKQGLKCPFKIVPEYITIHEVNSAQDAETLARYATQSLDPIAAHFFVDEKQVIQTIPLNRNAFACGDGSSGVGNTKSISIEICRSQSKKEELYYASVDNAIWLTKKLMKELNIKADKVVRHYDWSGVDCPQRMMREGLWNDFKKKLKGRRKEE